MTNKLKMHTPNLTEANIAKLAELFPGCLTEARDERTGELKYAINFDLLRQELSDHVVDGPRERYQLDWPGKREALLAANAPITKTMRPCRDESVNFDTTRNLFIEGDNLDALKLLQETFLGQVDLIFIDPPYNTTRDFIYLDDYTQALSAYLRKSGQTDESGGRLVLNSEANGRLHSDWLSMMAARLRVARGLLSNTGAILICIDEHELPNLWALANEVFGAEHFVECFVYDKKAAAKGVPPLNMVSSVHEYILAFSRGPNFRMNGKARSPEGFANPDGDPRGLWRNTNCKSTVADQSRAFGVVDPATGHVYTDTWAHSPQEMDRMASDGTLIFPANGVGQVRKKEYFNEFPNANTPIKSSLGLYDAQANTQHLERLLGANVFPNPKHLKLIQDMLSYAMPRDGVVVDFFAGSCTVVEALLRLNADDGGRRRYIVVQIPQPTPVGSNAKAAGFETLADIGKERIRRAGIQVAAVSTTTAPALDIGFRVLKIDSSNMEDIYYTPDTLKQDQIDLLANNIKADRTPEDLLFQVLVDWGVDLSLPITQETIEGKQVFFVDQNALAACFDDKVDEALVRELAKRKPLRAVFRDCGYNSDSTRVNVVQIFKLLSPSTDVKNL